MSDSTLKKLQDAYQKLEEGDSYTGPSANKVYGKGGIEPVKGYGDKAVKPVDRKDGAQGAKEQGKADHGSKEAVENSVVKPVSREPGASGAKEAAKNEHGTDKAVEGTNVKPVDREPGSAGAPKEYNQDFRARVKSALGLPLDDKLNQTGKGLGK